MKKQENKPQLKKVKIDEHIRNSKKGNEPTPARKRGRPRKNPESFSVAGKTDSTGHTPLFNSNDSESEALISNAESQATIEPVYDTTEEAKGFLRAPFDVAAGLTGIAELSLYPEELDALAPTFKPVYDKYIVPNLGENAIVIAFSVVLIGVTAKKVQVYRKAKGLDKPEAITDSIGTTLMPSIPVEHHT